MTDLTIKRCSTHGNYMTDACPRCGKAQSPQIVVNPAVEVIPDTSTLYPVRLLDKKGKKKKGKNSWAYRGLLFDSKPEATRYGYLKDKQDAGIIRHLIVQPKMIIRPGFELTNPFYAKTKKDKNRSIGVETYTPDYAYLYNGLLMIEDVKGISKGKPYSKSASTRSQKHLMHRYKDRHHVVFILVTEQRGDWRYWQASTGYPEIDFTLDYIGQEIAA